MFRRSITVYRSIEPSCSAYSEREFTQAPKVDLSCLDSGIRGRKLFLEISFKTLPPGDEEPTMIDVSQVLDLQARTVSLWHQQPIENTYSGLWQLVCQQHAFNYQLWHQEDIARSVDVSDQEIACVKRAIDGFNQARNDTIEKIDDWLTAQLAERNIHPKSGARQNTETPGSAIDRLSIMALRLYHYREQLERTDADADAEHLTKVRQRIALCEEQRDDLSRSLTELLQAIMAGERIHKTYRQMKMYNDPTLNPYLYQSK